jgi:hypothetical protein
MTKFSHVTTSSILSDIYNATKYMTKNFSHLLVVLVDRFGGNFSHCFSH